MRTYTICKQCGKETNLSEQVENGWEIKCQHCDSIYKIDIKDVIDEGY